MMQRVKRKIKSRQGVALLVVLLAVAVILALLLILVIPGYLEHLRDAELTMDRQSVATATEVVKIQHLQDGVPAELTFYYYDELTHSIKERSTIKGYGRSPREDNLREETGAKGIPHLPEEDGGAQLLVVTMQGDEMVNIRWTGNVWSFWDYYYMKQAERDALSPEDWRAMDAWTVRQAKRRALAKYHKDYYNTLSNKKDPGIAVYDYDLITDTLYYDETMSAGGSWESVTEGETDASGFSGSLAALPKKAQVMSPGQIRAYSLSDAADMSGSIVQILVHGEEARTQWVEGDHSIERN